MKTKFLNQLIFKKKNLLIRALFLLFFAGAVPLAAQPEIETLSTDFSPADPNRTAMDIGGAWNGSTEVTNTTGDTFSVTYKNNGSETAFDFTGNVTLPSGFIYVPNTAAVSTLPASGATVTADFSGNVLTFDTDGFDLEPGQSITFQFGLYADATVGTGSPLFNYNRRYSLTKNGPPADSAPAVQQSILVLPGDTSVNITPKQQERAINETAEFTIMVRNTGLGGLFDVTIDESAIYPIGGNLDFIEMIQAEPALAASSSNGGSILTLPYLAPDEVFVANVSATVLSCGTIVNVVSSDHRASTTPATDSAPVQIDLRQPLVKYSIPNTTLEYNDSKEVEIIFENTGLGSAYDFTLETTLPDLNVAVSNVAPGWSYNPASGIFTYTANSGKIDNNATIPLTFHLEASDICDSSGSGIVHYIAHYENACGDTYTIPQESGSVSAAADTPSISLTQSVNSSRISVGNEGSYTIELSAESIENITTDTIVVTTDLDPMIKWDISAGKNLQPIAGTVIYTPSLHAVTWTVPKWTLTEKRTLTIDFVLLPEPCNAGETIESISSTNATTSQSCTLHAQDKTTFFASNNPGLFANQYFDVTPRSGGSYTFETGDPTGSGQGDLIEFKANYEFGNSYPGTWSDSVYEDSFAGISQMTLAENSLVVTGSFGTETVPSSAITNLSPGFQIDLGFLANLFNDDNVAGKSILIRYQTTAPDEAITSGTTRSIQQTSNLYLANADSGSGICNEAAQDRFTQGVFYNLAHAAAQISLEMNGQIEVCKPEILTITVGNQNFDSRNVLTTLHTDGSDFTYDTSYTPEFGGGFAGNIQYQPNNGIDPTFTFTGDKLTETGTIKVRVWRTANGNIASTPLEASVVSDSKQTATAANRVYPDDSSYTPSRIRKANLAMTVTPGTLSVTGTTIEYVTYVSNTDAGTAYGSTLTNTLPPGITINESDTNTANPNHPVFVSGQDLTWDLGDIASGETIKIKLIANVETSGCSIDITNEEIVASWGCDNTPFQEIKRTPPSFTFPAGKMQVVHDTSQSVARLCEPGKVVIIARNTGPTNVLNIEISEVIPTSILSIAGAPEYRINGGPLQPTLLPPTGDGSSGNPYIWTKNQIPELEKMVPAGVDGPTEIRIEFDLSATEDLATNSPVLQAFASGEISCGDTVQSPGQTFSIPVERPVIEMTKTGRNITANPSGSFQKTVYGGAGDEIEWQIEIENNGSATAHNLRLSDLLSGSGGNASISGPGHPNTSITSDQVIALPDLNKGDTQIYTITETLGSTCVDENIPAKVTWGCINNGNNAHSNVFEPGKPTDSAKLVMIPEITSGADLKQKIEHLPGGRAKIEVTIENKGGNAHNLELTNTFPNSDMVLDESAPPAFDLVATHYPILTSSITGFDLDNSDTLAPKLEFQNSNPSIPMLRYGDRLKVTYFVRPTIFDTQMATTFPDLENPESGTSLDPAYPASGTNTVRIDYTSSCDNSDNHSTDQANIELQTPNLDITAVGPNSDGNNVLSGTETVDYTFTITNVGRNGSIADFITADFPDLGSGWNIQSIELTTPGTDGTGGTIQPGGEFTPAQFGTLDKNQSAVVTVKAAYSGNPGPLTLKIRTRGEARGEDGNSTGNYYSMDQRAQRVIGVSLSKTLTETSEPTTSGADLLVGEEATWRYSATFFGLEDDVSNLTIRGTPAQAGGQNAHTSLGYVSHSFTGNNDLPLTASAPTPVTRPSSVAESRIEFTTNTMTASSVNNGSDTFEADVVLRGLNTDQMTHNKSLQSNLGVQFTYLGKTFGSNHSSDGFNSEAAFENLHEDKKLTVRRPEIDIEKTVRNVTKNGSFSPEAVGEAGDILEFKLTVTNDAASDGAPLFSINVDDQLPAKLILLTTDIGADTSENGAVDIPTTGITGGDGAAVSFTPDNTPIGNAGTDLDQLDPGQSITLLYRAQLAQAVNPNESLQNEAVATGQTLLDPSGNQTDPKGLPDEVHGADTLTSDPAIATARIIGIDQQKTIEETSESTSPKAFVQIGEQILYQIHLTLPHGTVPDFSVTDKLPDGLALIDNNPVVTIGADLSVETNSFSQNGQNLKWEFGETIADGDDIEITIEYLTQVRNISENSRGTELTNEAAYNFTGLPEDDIEIATQTVTIAEPDIEFSVGVRNVTRESGSYLDEIDSEDEIAPDAGDILEYQLTITNGSGSDISAAMDLAITATLPEGLTYLTGETSVDSSSGVVPNGFQPGDPDISNNGETLIWGRTQSPARNLDIEPGGSLIFHFQTQVDDDSRPLQKYLNSIIVDWTSLDGDPLDHTDLGISHENPGDELGERTGIESDALNSYLAKVETSVTARNTTAIEKEHSDATLPLDNPDNGFRIGDLVTYTFAIELQEGELHDFAIEDNLPNGLAFVETVSITPATGSDGLTYTTPVPGTTAPAADETGTISWEFGNLANSGDNDENDKLEIVYTARVLDENGIPHPGSNDTTTELTNRAIVSFKDADGNPLETESAQTEIDVEQPYLTIEKKVLSPDPVLNKHVARPGDSLTFQLTIENEGTAPAYNPSILDLIPAEMRDTAPQLIAARINGTDILGDLQNPTWNNSTGEWKIELIDANFSSEAKPILPGKSLVLEYTATLNDDAPKGKTIKNRAIVEKHFSKPENETEERREYDETDPAEKEIIIGLEITGFVYHDIDPNGTRDDFENWSDGVTVYVNLIDPATNTTFLSQQVDPGEGDYTLTNIPPGDFKVIVTSSSSSTTAEAPSPWLFRIPADGTRQISLTTSDRHNQDFGLYEGIGISGVVFKDDGSGGGNANDGRRNGGEKGLSGATVRILDSSNSVLNSTQTDGTGQFQLYVPETVPSGSTLFIEAIPPSNHIATGADLGNSGGSFDRNSVRITFTYTSGQSTSGLQFGMVPENAFLNDGQETILPGATAFYRHTYIAGSAGTVTFSIANTATPSIPWSQVIIHDLNENGTAEGNEPVITDIAIPVTAGQEIHLLLKESSPSNAPFNATSLSTITATFNYTNADPSLEDIRTREDLTTIGDRHDAGLHLAKEVDTTSALPGETLTYTVRYTNVGTDPLRELVIYDRTPHYTEFVSAEIGPDPLPDSLTGVTIENPNPGEAGPIVWRFDGELGPGLSGIVIFKVKIKSM